MGLPPWSASGSLHQAVFREGVGLFGHDHMIQDRDIHKA
jgi:hypothetical protein